MAVTDLWPPHFIADFEFLLLQILSSSAAAQSLMVLATPFVTTQPLFDADRSLIGTFVSVGRHSLGFKQSARIEMDYAFRAKSEAFLAHRSMPGIAASEILRGRLINPVGYALTQHETDIDVPP
jgi:hypothetical protein